MYKDITMRIIMALIAILFTGPMARSEFSARLKDIAVVEGVRENQLMGYGIVVGLNGTGDKSSSVFSQKAIANMMKELGISLSAKDIKMKNVAAVVVTAQIPPFVRPGVKIDCLVSSIGDATDLSNGVLLMTPLAGPDGNVYAVAQGPLSLGGYSAGSGRTKKIKNHPTVARIPNGAIVEREIPIELEKDGHIKITLNQPDFTTAYRIAKAINEKWQGIARCQDAGIIDVNVPQDLKNNLVGFVYEIESLYINPDTVAKVVINERTGTVVAGKDVRIDTIAISHGSLSIEVKSKWMVSQPTPLSSGQTATVADDEIKVVEQKGNMAVMESGATIGDLANALNALGVSPRDMISIFQAIKQSGALAADIQII